MIAQNLTISSSPHIASRQDVPQIMRDVFIALLPAAAGAIYFFRTPALINILVALVSAVLTEYGMQRILKRPVTIHDYSAAVTGILLAFNIPSTLPWWMTMIGSVFAIAVVKQLFGGLGYNFMNPALAARAFLMASWLPDMTAYPMPFHGADAIAAATPLSLLKSAQGSMTPYSLLDMFIGNIPGCIGETSAVLLLIGAAYLFYRKVITPTIPVVYIGTTLIGAFLFSGMDVSAVPYNLLGGGLILGAFYMATDYASSPVSVRGQVLYAAGGGLLTSVIRYYGGYPEGVSYSILLMNVATPLIDQYIKPPVFGRKKK